MGISLPLAIGAASADKKLNVLAVTGDGSIELNIKNLKQCPTIIVISSSL